MVETTTIQIDRETWRQLNARKNPGDDFNDVVQRLLAFAGDDQEGEPVEQYIKGAKSDDVRVKVPSEVAEVVEEPAAEAPEGFEAVEEAAEVREALRDWRPGRSAEEREERREIGAEVLRWLRDRGSGTRSEIVDELYHQEEIGIEADSWWRRIARAALDHAREKGLTEYEAGSGVWRWAG